jgi:hypothetical protein
MPSRFLTEDGLDFLVLEDYSGYIVDESSPVVLPFGNTFDLFLQLVPPESTSSIRYYAERCYCNGTLLKFSDLTLTAAEKRIGIDLELTLVDLSQIALIKTANATFQLDIQVERGGAWHTIFNAGRLENSDHSIQWGEYGADDTFSFTVVSNADDAAPDNPLVLFDPARVTLNQADFEILKDSEGNEIEYELEEVPGLSTHKAFERLRTELGYTAFKSNIPDFQIRRLDWGHTSLWIEPVAEKISTFNALIYPVGTELWFQDATMPITEGSPIPLPLTVSNYKSAQISAQESRLDGFVVDFIANENEYDELVVRIETPPDDVEGTTRTAMQIYYLDYIKDEQIIKSQYEATFKQIYGYHEYSETTRQIGSFEEQITYDSMGQQIASEVVEEALVFNDPLWSLEEISRKPTGYKYAGHPYKQDSTYLQRKVELETGKIAINEDEEIFGKPSRYGFRDALRRESISDTTTYEEGEIYRHVETYDIETKDRVRVRGRKHDLLKGITAGEYDEPRTGDVSIDGNSTDTKPIIVYPSDGYTRTGKPLRPFSGDEVPWEYLHPLARRTLDLLINKNNRGTVLKIGWILGLRRGLTRALYLRNDVFLGNFLIEGYTMRGSNLGTPNAVRETTLNVREI